MGSCHNQEQPIKKGKSEEQEEESSKNSAMATGITDQENGLLSRNNRQDHNWGRSNVTTFRADKGNPFGMSTEWCKSDHI